MTPDLSTPEGRAELRALLAKAQPGPWFLEKQRGYCDTYVKTAHPDWAPTEKGPHKNFIAEFGLGNEPTGHFYDQNAEMVCAAVNSLGPLLDILDAAYAPVPPNSRPKTVDEMREMMATDPEYRAGFWRRVAESDRARHERRLDDLQAKLDAAHAEIAGLTSDIADALDNITKGESHIDVLDATIERLTAPVTEEEGRACANVYLDINILTPMREVLDAFIARRKDTAP